jgi:hypothetical protein
VDAVAPGLLEDVFATENIERMIQHCNGRPGELLLRADEVCVRGRRMFEKLILDEQKAASNKSAEAAA